MKFEVYQDKRGEWRWRLRARNGRQIAASGEGYEKVQKVYSVIRSMKKGVADAETERAQAPAGREKVKKA